MTQINSRQIATDTNNRFVTDTQITTWNAKQNAMSIASDSDMQTGTDNTKYATALRLKTWWTWLKTQAQTFTAKIGFGLINLASSANASPATGDVWFDGTDINFQQPGNNSKLLQTNNNSALAGTTERTLVTDSSGNVTANYNVRDGEINDSDIVTAINAASFTSGAYFIANITPANSKIMYWGQVYRSNQYKYEAIQDNVVQRFTAS